MFYMSKRNLILVTLCFVSSIFCLTLTAQPRHQVTESDSMHYRGKREPRESGDFLLLTITNSRIDSSTVQMSLFFNQSFDPNSLDSATYIVNGKRVTPDGKNEYTRDGKTARIKLNIADKNFSFEVRGIKSYNGKDLQAVSASIKDTGEFKVP